MRVAQSKGGLGALHIHAEQEGPGQSSMGVKGNMEKASSCQPIGAQDGGVKAGRDALAMPVNFDRLDAQEQEDFDRLSSVRDSHSHRQLPPPTRVI